MSDKDIGNTTTQTMYEMATQPVFIDRSQDPQQEISWEVSGEGEIPTPPQLDGEKEEVVTPEDREEIQEDQQPIPDTDPESEEDSEETEKKKKKNRTSERNRIGQLVGEVKHLKSVVNDVLKRNEFLESKAAQKEKEAFATQENYLTAQKERVKKYLADAIEEGDPSKIAEANDLLSQYNAEILLMGKQKESIQANPQPQNNYKQPYYQEPIETPYQEVGKEWIHKNSWANPDSPNFDQEMYEEADNYSIRLARKYKLEGRGDEIGTPEFFDEITDHVKQSYDISPPPPPSKPQSRDRMQMKTDQSPPVGPVNRQGPLNQAPLKAKDISLTPEQKEIAYSLRGFVRDPKTGKRIEDNKTLEEIYKRNLMRGNG